MNLLHPCVEQSHSAARASGPCVRSRLFRAAILVGVWLTVTIAPLPLDAQEAAAPQPPVDETEPDSASLRSPVFSEAESTVWTNLLLEGTLSGWVQFGGNASFIVQRNEIVGTIRPGIADSFLCTEAEYGDFELELECKIDFGLNSGIQIRSHVDREAARLRVVGYQVEIDSSSRAWTGSLYDQARSGWLVTTDDNRAAREAFVLGQWNQIRVVATGPRIQTWVNGVEAVDFSAATDRSGFIGLQIHRTDIADSLEVRWRRLRIRERSAEETAEEEASDGEAPSDEDASQEPSETTDESARGEPESADR